VLRDTNSVFPGAILGMSSLEVLMNLEGGSSSYLRRVPNGIASFSNLRELDLSSNLLDEVLCSRAGYEIRTRDPSLGNVKRPVERWAEVRVDGCLPLLDMASRLRPSRKNGG
jgi:hypothetical protein